MRMIIRKTRRNRAGFSLAETLIVILILLMVSAIVGAAIPTASTVYKKTVDTANAQLLLSTTMTVLRDELNAAKNISVSSDKTEITFISGITGNKSIIKCSSENGLEITVYPDANNPTDAQHKPETRLLVSEKASTSGMILTCSFSSSSLDKGMIVVEGIAVQKSGYSKALAERESYTIRLISSTTAVAAQAAS